MATASLQSVPNSAINDNGTGTQAQHNSIMNTNPRSSGSGSTSSTSTSSTNESTMAASMHSSSDYADAEMAPRSTSPRLVRFDERCVLIPENAAASPFRSTGPRIGMLDVTVPLPSLPWRRASLSPTRRRQAPSGTSTEETLDPLGEEDSTEPAKTAGVVLKVPFPVFRRRSHSAVQNIPETALSPCLVHKDTCGVAASPSSAAAASASSAEKRSPRRQIRSASLPLYSVDPKLETIPLRPCCAKCLAACDRENGIHCLPVLKESEQSPSRGRSNLKSSPEEDWCAGMHFTKGALRLRRSASREQGHGLSCHLNSHSLHAPIDGTNFNPMLVRVDEVELKRSSGSASSSPRGSLSLSIATERLVKPSDAEGEDKCAPQRLCLRALDRVKGTSKDSGSTGSASSSPIDEPEEDLFPLPSPKRSPAASPADSALNLPAFVSSSASSSSSPPLLAEPRKLEAAIRAKMREREREVEAEAGSKERLVPSTLPMSIRPKQMGTRSVSTPSPSSSPSKSASAQVSHFHSNLEEIEFDPSLPEPDALPPTSEILLNSPPGSPNLNTSFITSNSGSNGHKKSTSLTKTSSRSTTTTTTDTSSTPAPSTSLPSLPRASSPGKNVVAVVTSVSPAAEVTVAAETRPRRRASLSQITAMMRAGVGVLRGIVPTGPSAGPSPYNGGMVV